MNTFEGQLLANRYLLKKELGRGGMAIIYTGTDIVLKREVAVKILYPQLISDSSLLQRFVNEARIIAKLNYKSIVSLYDISEQEGVPFLILEYIPGEDLRRLYDRLYGKDKKPFLEIALIIVYIVCDAVAHAHAQGIVHRDIKPENVLISGQGDLKITDFGLAHILTDTRITITGAAIGSPEFMSPEHINSSNISAASDVFSLGSLLYWLISGRSPFYADNTMSILNNISRNDYKPVNKTVPGIDNWIADVIDTCLKPEPGARYRDASQLCDALYNGINGFASDPYSVFKAYINSPDETARELVNNHNGIRYNTAVSYIKSNRFEKALSIIGTMLETGQGHEDAIRLMKALKYNRYKRWAHSAAEVLLVVLLTTIIAREDYNETPVNPVRELRPRTVDTNREGKPPSALNSMTFSNGVNSSPQVPVQKNKGTVSSRKTHKTSSQRTVMPKAARTAKQGAGNSIGRSDTVSDIKSEGNLEIITYPWAMVFIDDRYIGETPRLKSISLPAGEHKIYIINPYLKPYTGIVEIKPNETITKRIDLDEPASVQ